MRAARQVLASVSFALAVVIVGTMCSPPPALAQAGRIEILPIIFVPSDSRGILADGRIDRIRTLLRQHLVLAQAHYRALLQTDSFKISDRNVVVYELPKRSADYETRIKTGGPDTAHMMMQELFAWTGEDRYSSRTVYLVVFARAPAHRGETLGGGRTFNGRPNSGGGFVHLELSALLTDAPYAFQSTLVHELGHAFGLTHPDCHGYDLAKSELIMSYNLRHHSKGLQQSRPLAGLSPEDYVVLAQNRLAFPDFIHVLARHNPTGKRMDTIDRCYLGPMDKSIGAFRRLPGVGYELLFEGKVASGPETSFYSPSQARTNCAHNMRVQKGRRVECRYDGAPLRLD